MLCDEIDIDRIERRLDTIWSIGQTEKGGVTRLAYTEEESEAIAYIVSELDDDFNVHTDSVGNVFATTDPDADQSYYLGSHLDSVFNGGRLDGALGVVVALEAIEAVRAAGESPPLPPTLTIFRAEESTRFGQWAIGSRGALGMLTVEDFSAVDQSNIPLWQAMQQAGFQPSNLSEPTLDLDRVAGFLEVHIEQGRVLDENGDDIGIVSGIRAPVRYRITVTGDYDHSGATPMGMRRDAIAAAAEMVITVERLGTEAAEDGDIVATIGDLTAVEGAINKVCGEVSFPIDIRSNDREYRDTFEETMLDELKTIATHRDVELDAELVDQSDPVELDESMVEMLDDIAASISTNYRRLPSGGGHDAMNLQHANVSTGMVFVPSIEGISHNPREETKQVAVRDATEILARGLLHGLS
jgi:hydantoinase/carbamoylase family amidase